MEKTYNIDIWYLRPGDLIRYKLVDYTIIRFVENDDDKFFLLLYNHNSKDFELIPEYLLNYNFRFIYTISEHEKVETFFTDDIKEIFQNLFEEKFKEIINYKNSDLKRFCDDFDTELKKKNISLKEQIEVLNKKYKKRYNK